MKSTRRTEIEKSESGVKDVHSFSIKSKLDRVVPKRVVANEGSAQCVCIFVPYEVAGFTKRRSYFVRPMVF